MTRDPSTWLIARLSVACAIVFARQGAFDRQRGAPLNAAIVGAVLPLAAVLIPRSGSI